MKTILTLALYSIIMLLLFGSPVFARLGETPAEIEKRYGKPQYQKIEESCRFVGYTLNDFMIIVTFILDKAEGETIVKADKSALSDTEIASILKANEDDNKWIYDEVHSNLLVKEWFGFMHGGAVATYKLIGEHIFDIKSEFCTNCIRAMEERKAHNNTKGF